MNMEFCCSDEITVCFHCSFRKISSINFIDLLYIISNDDLIWVIYTFTLVFSDDKSALAFIDTILSSFTIKPDIVLNNPSSSV